MQRSTLNLSPSLRSLTRIPATPARPTHAARLRHLHHARNRLQRAEPYVLLTAGVGAALTVTSLWAYRESFLPVAFADARPEMEGGAGRVMHPVVGLNKTELHPSETIDPATLIPHPSHLHPSSTSSSSSTQSALTLIGLGVRAVSFLRVKVYSVGFYLETVALGGLSGLPGWEVDPSLSTSSLSGIGERGMSLSERLVTGGEGMMRRVVELPVVCAVRIVPTRTTDFGHLRDGFTRALLARQKTGNKNGSISAEEDERISASIQTFKSIFPRESVPKGGELLMVKTVDGCLSIEYEGKVMGKVVDPWVAKEMILAYFADDNVISAALKTSVAKGFETLLQAPQAR